MLKKVSSYICIFSKLTCFLLGLVIITNIIGEQLSLASNTSNVYCKIKWKEFYKLKRNSLDVLYLGCSHVYRGYDANRIDNALNTKSYNMGTPLQKPVETYYVLKEILRTQKPKLVVLDAFWLFFTKENYFFPKTWNFDGMKNSEAKLGYLLNDFDVEQYLPAISYAARYHNLLYSYIGDLQDKKKSKELKEKADGHIDIPSDYAGKGYVKNYFQMTQKDIDNIGKDHPARRGHFRWDPKQLEYFIKTVELCSDNNIKLLITTLPCSPTAINVYNKYYYPYSEIHDKIKQIAEEYCFPYYDFNLKIDQFSDEDFSDWNHLNYLGVDKVSKMIIPVIKKNYKNNN